MNTLETFLSRLAVCSWSLQPADPAQLVEQLRAVGLNRVQLDLDPFREQPEVWSGAPELFAQAGIEAVSGMFRTVGEDYSTLESIRLTGGLVPDATWEQNWANLQVTVETARRLGLRLVMFHAGFVPHDPQSPVRLQLVDRIRRVARLFAGEGITLCCETGQETGPDLKAFLGQVNEPNLAVNFDPANMLLYDNGDPIEALRLVGQWVKSCHLKDARITKVPGTWGEEVVVGTGQVDWPAFVRTLAGLEFDGYLCLEREAGDQRVEDLRAGRLFVEKLIEAHASTNS